MIVPDNHSITLSNNSRYYKSYIEYLSYRVQIVRFTHYYIAIWRNHSEHTASGTTSDRTATGVDSIFRTKLERRTRHLMTCQTLISTICTGHWLPPYALRLLYGSGMQGKSKIPIYGCSFLCKRSQVL